MFRKILIANRGEIAVRIMQTCRELGIASVAVYSSADAHALHVQRADEAYHIGPAPALDSYLSIDALLDAARRSGADAIHPGYGFLAESAEFARAVSQAGLVWIGPPADVIALLGDKVAAKKLASAAGVPVVPGYYGEDQRPELMLAEADAIGYPVMLKAAAGGGGKGMRVVSHPAELAAALEGARREARSAFGDDRMFLEKLVARPRHVEIQVLIDETGNGVYLGERDCSVQRRHQKVVEEAPSPVMTPQLRGAMGDDALRLAQRAGYRNAGTVEFLFGGDEYYFLEMNTRIQVEHPVTEMVTGLDLVRLQIEIALGRRLGLSQLDVQIRGHAIEARLYAEDPQTNFLPATGTLDVFRPPHGPGIRNDVGVFEGAEISPYYDPLLAKLIVHAETREAAVARLRDALSRYPAVGVTTNQGFLSWLLDQRDFQAGSIDTDFVNRTWPPADAEEPPPEVLLAAACFELTERQAPRTGTGSLSADPYDPWRQTNGWRLGGVSRDITYGWSGREYQVSAQHAGETCWRMSVNGSEYVVGVQRAAHRTLVLRQGPEVQTFVVVRVPQGLDVELRGVVYRLARPQERAAFSRGGRRARTDAALTAPMPGTVVKVEVQEGQRVSAHEPLVVLEAMKMEHVVHAPHEGVVRAILYQPGELVPAGSPVVELEES